MIAPSVPTAAASVRDVCARIAALVLPGTDTSAVGGFTLRPAQRQTLGELRAAIAEFGGALLADPPGTGKTVLALAAAQGAASVLVLAPSALRAQWLAASEAAEVSISFVSLEALSRGAVRAPAEFVIIDEAHHLRTTSARRYSRAAAACVGAEVLLLTATPVVNRSADRDALLALFMGSRAERLSPLELGRVLVRRRESGQSRPSVSRRGPIAAHTEIEGVASALRHLPPPLPVAGGPPATALIVMTLAMAWQSSLAAFDAALRRREQRGGALVDLLRAGRLPSVEALRHWVSHDDATQLALPLLVAPCTDPAPPTVGAMLEAVDTHLTAIASLRRLVAPHRTADSARRASALRALLAEYPGRRLVVFARHAETIRALHAALRGEPGVVAIIGTRVRAASGRWNRDEVLRAIGPRARAYDPLDPRAIRLVLSTDALAEGVEMQGVGVVVHADLPWTPARLEQRVGRVVRSGSAAPDVVEAWFSAPRGAGALVKLGARLARKSRTRRHSVRDGEARGAIVAVLERWSGAVVDGDGEAYDRSASAEREVCAECTAAFDGFVSVTSDQEGMRLICGVHDGVRWRVSSAPRRVLSVLRAIEESGREPLDEVLRSVRDPGPHALTAMRVRRLLARVLVRRGALELAGSAVPGATYSRGERRLVRVRERFARSLERAPALVRPVLAERQAHLLRLLARPLEAARERRIDDLLRADHDAAAFARRLGALLWDRPDRSSAGGTAGAAHDQARNQARERARDQARAAPILLLRRASAPPEGPAAARPAASTGTAATR